MSNVHSLSDALLDSMALADVAASAGVTIAQARAVVAALAEIPAAQVVRVCGIANRDRERQREREERKERRR